jgi:hypothetical protein
MEWVDGRKDLIEKDEWGDVYNFRVGVGVGVVWSVVQCIGWMFCGKVACVVRIRIELNTQLCIHVCMHALF